MSAVGYTPQRVVLVVDVGRGQEALVFRSQVAAESFLGRYPIIDDAAQGMVPIVSSRDLLARAKIAEGQA